MGIQKATFQAGGISFQTRIPGAYSLITTKQTALGNVSIGNGVSIGESDGGKPLELYQFSSPNDAEEILRGGKLLDHVKMCFRPGPGLIPQSVYAMRANDGTRSLRVLKVGVVGIVNVHSFDYGKHTNNISMFLENGTNSGKKITVRDTSTVGESETYIVDDIEKNQLNIQYSGSGSRVMTIDSTNLKTEEPGAPGSLAPVTTGGGNTSTGTVTAAGIPSETKTYTITVLVAGDTGTVEVKVNDGTSDVVTQTLVPAGGDLIIPGSGITLTFTNGVDPSFIITDTFELVATGPTSGTVDIDILLADYENVSSISQYLDQQANYASTVVATDSSDSPNEFDEVVSADLSVQYTITSNLFALIESINGIPIITGEKIPSASNDVPDNDSVYVPLSGGTPGQFTSTEVTEALLILESKDIQFITTHSESEGIHGLISDHCSRMVAPDGKRERQAILGGSRGEIVSQVINRSKVLSNELVSLCYPGFKDINFKAPNTLIDYSPAFFAAKVMGAVIALSLNEPATNKIVQVSSWERETKNDLEDLLRYGIWVGGVSDDDRNIHIRSITTYQGSDLKRVEFSIMRQMLFMSRDLRTAISQSYVGRAGVTGRIGELTALLRIKLTSYADNMDLLVGDGESPPFTNESVRQIGDQILTEWQGDPTPPINFVFINSIFTSKGAV